MQGRDMNRLKIRLKNLQRRIQDEMDAIERFEHRGMFDWAERRRVRLAEMEVVEAEILAEIRAMPTAASAVKHKPKTHCPKGHAFDTPSSDKRVCRECHPKTHCPHGHEYAGENLIIDTKGFRRCRACKATQDSASRYQRLALAKTFIG